MQQSLQDADASTGNCPKRSATTSGGPLERALVDCERARLRRCARPTPKASTALLPQGVATVTERTEQATTGWTSPRNRLSARQGEALRPGAACVRTCQSSVASTRGEMNIAGIAHSSPMTLVKWSEAWAVVAPLSVSSGFRLSVDGRHRRKHGGLWHHGVVGHTASLVRVVHKQQKCAHVHVRGASVFRSEAPGFAPRLPRKFRGACSPRSGPHTRPLPTSGHRASRTSIMSFLRRPPCRQVIFRRSLRCPLVRSRDLSRGSCGVLPLVGQLGMSREDFPPG